MSINGKFARHISEEMIVQIIQIRTQTGPTTRIMRQMPEPKVFVDVACECGDQHSIPIEDFLEDFEMIQEITLRSVEIDHDADDTEFWVGLQEFMVDQGLDGVVEIEHDADDLEFWEALHEFMVDQGLDGVVGSEVEETFEAECESTSTRVH